MPEVRVREHGGEHLQRVELIGVECQRHAVTHVAGEHVDDDASHAHEQRGDGDAAGASFAERKDQHGALYTTAH
jgi:hypothetical protein